MESISVLWTKLNSRKGRLLTSKTNVNIIILANKIILALIKPEDKAINIFLKINSVGKDFFPWIFLASFHSIIFNLHYGEKNTILLQLVKESSGFLLLLFLAEIREFQ